mmetsp:Transcript_7869/g.21455  ORF Transcript_7869/g.21455 Transcript_7869/m.21455 type:complete len:396 (+) Transcript_7869:247-1434(+)
MSSWARALPSCAQMCAVRELPRAHGQSRSRTQRQRTRASLWCGQVHSRGVTAPSRPTASRTRERLPSSPRPARILPCARVLPAALSGTCSRTSSRRGVWSMRASCARGQTSARPLTPTLSPGSSGSRGVCSSPACAPLTKTPRERLSQPLLAIAATPPSGRASATSARRTTRTAVRVEAQASPLCHSAIGPACARPAARRSSSSQAGSTARARARPCACGRKCRPCARWSLERGRTRVSTGQVSACALWQSPASRTRPRTRWTSSDATLMRTGPRRKVLQPRRAPRRASCAILLWAQTCGTTLTRGLRPVCAVHRGSCTRMGASRRLEAARRRVRGAGANTRPTRGPRRARGTAGIPRTRTQSHTGPAQPPPSASSGALRLCRLPCAWLARESCT